MEIRTLPYTDILKLELTFLASTTMKTIEKHNPEVLKIGKTIELLKNKQTNIILLNKCYGAHPITKSVERIRQICFMYAQSIVFRMKIVMKEQANDLTEKVLNTNVIVNNYLYKFATVKIKVS